MIFHENRLPADDSHEISYLIFFRKLGKMSQNLSSAAVVIGALKVKVHDINLAYLVVSRTIQWHQLCVTVMKILRVCTSTGSAKNYDVQ